MTAATTTVALSNEDFRKNFPFENICPKQISMLKEICDAYYPEFKVLIIEVPAGFGKCPGAIAVARTLGSSYICSATKDLQSQYVKDFAFLRAVKGRGNYSCLIKEDFIENNNNYACVKCGIFDGNTGTKTTNTNECNHQDKMRKSSKPILTLPKYRNCSKGGHRIF